jgi:hypothetical protein
MELNGFIPDNQLKSIFCMGTVQAIKYPGKVRSIFFRPFHSLQSLFLIQHMVIDKAVFWIA